MFVFLRATAEGLVRLNGEGGGGVGGGVWVIWFVQEFFFPNVYLVIEFLLTYNGVRFFSAL